MRTAILLFLISFLMLGCDAKKPPKEIDPDSIYDEIPLYDTSSSTAPYNYPNFQGAINQSELQYHSDNNITQKDLTNYKAAFFYADTNATMHFAIEKSYNSYETSSELRQVNSWSTADTNGNYLVASVKCLKPQAGITSYTWMWIQGTSSSYNYPLLTLFWKRSRKNLYDHLWANIMVSDPFTNNLTDWIDLGVRPEGFFDIELQLSNNYLIILFNRSVISFRNVSYWQNVQNYFKVGINVDRYDNGGEASVLFEDLHFYNDPNDVVTPHL